MTLALMCSAGSSRFVQLRPDPAPVLLVLLLALSGCEPQAGAEGGGPTLEAESDAIVNGHACDDAVRRSIVGLGLDSAALPLGSQSRCSGTLIASNLVLTARHCVAPLLTSGSPWDQTECLANGNANPAIHFGAASAAHVFVFDGLTSPAIAAARDVLVPSGTSLCNNDIALLVLDRHLSSKTPARVRAFTTSGQPVVASTAKVDRSKDPSLVVAGFGLLDDNVENHRGCQQRSVRVLAEQAHPSYYLGKHEFATSYGTCNGDSGGPVFDRAGLLVGVTSRGLLSCHGPGLYPDLAYHTGTIAKAMAAAAAAP